MKRLSPSSSCSSSSSCVESEIINVNELVDNKPKTKKARVKKNITPTNQDKAISTTNAGRRSSIYRGVTRHRWTGRFEAHLWDKSTWNSIQNKKGRQIYLGAYDNEEAAARTYDLAALKYWGSGTILNFDLSTYTQEIEAMEKMTKEEYLASLRRQSSGFSRGVSKYRGVARHHHNGRWEARIGRVFGNKYLYLGTYSTQEEAAAAYDMAAIEYRGSNAVTNFDVSVYAARLKEKKIELGTTSPSFSEQQQQCEQQHQQGEKQALVQPPVLNSDIHSSIDSVEIHEHDAHPWSLCMDQHQQGQEQQQEEKQALVQPPVLNSDIHSSIDSVEIHEHAHPWSLCMDPEFHPFPIPDVTYGKGGELPYLFGETGFQDDIEFIFDGPIDENLSFDTDSFFASSVKEEETEGEDHEKMTLPPLSSSSSPPSSSTATLVYCN